MVWERKERSLQRRGNDRVNFLIAIVFLFGFFIGIKLFFLQVIHYEDYSAIASGQHSVESKLLPERGEISITERKNGEEILYPFAVNKKYALIYAIPSQIEDKTTSEKIANSLFEALDKISAEKEVDDFFKEKDRIELNYQLSQAAALPEEERLAREAEIRRNLDILHNDKVWLAVREEDRKIELEKKKQAKLSEYYPILNKGDDPYEPICRKVGEDDLKKLYSLLLSNSGNTVESSELFLQNGEVCLKDDNLGCQEISVVGISHEMESYRYYPENNIGSHLLGFVRMENGENSGNYGLEGFFNKDLSGVAGSLKTELSATRDIIILNGREYTAPQNGKNLILTIDRSVEYFVCQELKKTLEDEGAEEGDAVIVDPKTGAIIAMCSLPDFDPNNYSSVEDISIFNNPAIFDQYEPGSVFKTITMAAALNEGKVVPETIYNDAGAVKKKGWDKPIKNSDYETKGAHGWVDMSKILELSLNTGAIFLREQLGEKSFVDYIKNFGFGEKTGIELEGEAPGDISNSTRKNPTEIDLDTISFGQAITVTPLQMIMSYAAIANNGILMKPYMVKEVINSDGSIEETKPHEIRRVISEKTANFVISMLINVVEEGHAKKAQISGYFIGGKTGTAQIPDKNGYSEDTIHTFVSIFPADKPQFVILTKINRPQKSNYAETSVVPLAQKIMDFVLKYYQVPKER
jgi:cell division protein FtsI/penicillin-binding protein 2